MTRNWKPGDVAMSKYGIVFLTESGWIFDDHDGPAAVSLQNLRPLVVIDPEDREQIERLAEVFCKSPSSGWVEAMQVALREYAEPRLPKPSEPIGLGAVVEDSRGILWIRTAPPAAGDPTWCSPSPSRTWSRWDYMNVVKVHSEGVTP